MSEENGVTFDDPILQDGFISIPVTVMIRDDLTLGAKISYGVIIRYGGQSRLGYIIGRISRVVGCTNRTAAKYLQELRSVGLIR